jgi:hypothetical protein
VESHHDLISLFEHDLFGKSVPTFPDRALDERNRVHAGADQGSIADSGLAAYLLALFK